MATGEVLQFDPGSGYGFVTADNGGEDVSLHASVFDGDPGNLVPGVPVQFQVMAGDRGGRHSQCKPKCWSGRYQR